MDKQSEILADPKAYAEEHKLVMVPPGLREVQLDIDSPQTPAHYATVKSILAKITRIENEKISVSRSGNLHITLTLGRDLTSTERILFQAVLGSDPVRELLTYKNTLDPNNTTPQFLFEKANA
jgi:hypothetical protein